jgi:hypothetical protein
MTAKLEELSTENALFLQEVDHRYRGIIKNTIRGILNNRRKYMDASVDENDLYTEFLFVVAKFADKLRQPGTVPLEARLRALARKNTLIFITKTKRRFEIIAKRPHELVGKYCEAFTRYEMASMRAEELEEE